MQQQYSGEADQWPALLAVQGTSSIGNMLVFGNDSTRRNATQASDTDHTATAS
jgi:hypothetical protein